MGCPFFSMALVLSIRQQQRSGRCPQLWDLEVTEARSWETGSCHCYSAVGIYLCSLSGHTSTMLGRLSLVRPQSSKKR